MPTRRNTFLADPKIGSGISALARAIGPHPEDEARGALLAQQQQTSNTQNQVAQQKLKAANLVQQAFDSGALVENPDGSISMPRGTQAATLLIRAALTADPTANINPLLDAINRGPDAQQKQKFAMELQNAKPMSETEAKGVVFQQLPPDQQRAMMLPPVETSAGATQSFAPGDPRAPGAQMEVRRAIPVEQGAGDMSVGADPAGLIPDAPSSTSALANSVIPANTQFTAPVQPKANPADSRPETGAVRQSIAKNEASMQQIDAAIQAIKSNPDALGLKQLLPGVITQRMPGGEENTGTLAQMGTVAAIRRHALFGGQLTSGEAGFSNEFIPQKTDTPEAAIQKLLKMKENVKSDQDTLLQVAKPMPSAAPQAPVSGPMGFREPDLPATPDAPGAPSKPVVSSLADAVTPQAPGMAAPPYPRPSPSPRGTPPIASAAAPSSSLADAVMPQGDGMVAMPFPKPSPIPSGTPPIAALKPITNDVIAQLLDKHQGDKDAARADARSMGYSLEVPQ